MNFPIRSADVCILKTVGLTKMTTGIIFYIMDRESMSRLDTWINTRNSFI